MMVDSPAGPYSKVTVEFGAGVVMKWLAVGSAASGRMETRARAGGATKRDQLQTSPQYAWKGGTADMDRISDGESNGRGRWCGHDIKCS